MNIDEIKNNAPDGATDYIFYKGTLSFHVFIDQFWYEITKNGNVYTHPTWWHLLKPL